MDAPLQAPSSHPKASDRQGAPHTCTPMGAGGHTAVQASAGRQTWGPGGGIYQRVRISAGMLCVGIPEKSNWSGPRPEPLLEGNPVGESFVVD